VPGEGVHTLEGVREVLRGEVRWYKERQVHSTTAEIYLARFERALQNDTHLFRPLKVPYPFESTKDILYIREETSTQCLPEGIH